MDCLDPLEARQRPEIKNANQEIGVPGRCAQYYLRGNILQKPHFVKEKSGVILLHRGISVRGSWRSKGTMNRALHMSWRLAVRWVSRGCGLAEGGEKAFGQSESTEEEDGVGGVSG